MALFYILAVGFTGLSLFGSAAGLALFNSSKARLLILANIGVAGLAALILLISSLVTTLGVKPAAAAIDKLGNDIGLRATVGGKFLGLTWTASALMIIAACYWVYEFFQSRKRGPVGRMEEKYGGGGAGGGRYSVESFNQPQYQREFRPQY